MEGGKMEYNTIFAKSFSRYEQKKLGYGALVGFLIVVLSFFTVFRPSFDYLPIMNLKLRMSSGLNMLMMEDTSVSQILQHNQQQPRQQEQPQNLTIASQEARQHQQQPRQEQKPQNLTNASQEAQQQQQGLSLTSIPHKLVTESEKKHEFKPVCNLLEPRSDFCDLNGDVRIHGNSSTIFFPSSQMGIRNESWRIRPYARKGDKTAMGSVTEFLVRSSEGHREGPSCAVNHSVPAIVFSVAGYGGNHFHAFSDILVPLFITSYQFHGEVQFLVTNSYSHWMSKYQAILEKLSRYQIINIDREDKIHCFPSMIVGFKHQKEFRIDPSISQNGYSMQDFRKFLRSTYSLKRKKAIRIQGHRQHKKPRLLIVTRKQTRSFTNEGEIVELARTLGYEVFVAEPALMTLPRFAHIVNSCDVMMGVHGAGLTNLVFLPSNAILIQIAPLGGLEWLCSHYFGEPALDMEIRYLEYKIREEESTLIDQYPLDHAVFKDPLSIHKQGWGALKAVYLEKQNVKLDVGRFRATLLEALELLHH